MAQQSTEHSGEEEPTPVVRVSVIDDDKRTAETVATYLGSIDNCLGDVFNDPAKALKHLARHGADIEITDVRMPNVDGLTVLRRVDEISEKTDVIVLTGPAEQMQTA